MPAKMRDLAAPVLPLSPDATAQAALQRFFSDAGLCALPVVDEDNRPVGLVTRLALSETFARAGSHMPIAGKQALEAASPRPAQVDADMPAAMVAGAAAKRSSRALVDGMIVHSDGQYVGFVSPEALLSVVAGENIRRAKAIKHLKSSAAKANASRADFLATIGHEIRTPLTGILGLADMLCEDDISKSAKGYARAIARSGDHLKRILDDLLDAARLDAGHLDLTLEPFDLKQFASEAEALWRGCAEADGIALAVSVKRSSEKRIEADPARLRQILFNLISNALKFTDSGTVSAEIETVQNDDGLRLVMRVTDTGTGIAPADRKRLFGAFERAENGAASEKDGVGLGLAIASKLAAAMDGGITLAENPGRGSVFTVDVTAQKAGPRLAVDNPEPPARRAFELGRVLLVEDHDVSRFVMREALRAAGWQVDAVENGLQAMQRASSADYQAVLCDLRLPDVNGEDLVVEFRACNNETAEAVMLAVTADVSPTRRAKALTAGFDAVIAKPIRSRALVMTLAEALLATPDRAILRRAGAL